MILLQMGTIFKKREKQPKGDSEMGHCLGFNKPNGLQLKTLGQDCPVFITLEQNYGDKITIPAGLVKDYS